MAERKTYVILGLGIFGSTIAKQLSKYNYEVIAIDKSLTCVERMADVVTQAVRADFTDIDQLRAIGVQDCDAAVVATGSLLEESVIGVMNLKELGVPYILAKAKNKKYREILLKIGADRVVRPEKEMGERIAKRLISQNIVDIIEIDGDYSMIEVIAPAKWVGNSLRGLQLRSRFGINVLGIRKNPDDHLIMTLDADYVIEKTDAVLMIAENDFFEKHSGEIEE